MIYNEYIQKHNTHYRDGLYRMSYTTNANINGFILTKSEYNKTYDKPDGKGAIHTRDGSTNEGF